MSGPSADGYRQSTDIPKGVVIPSAESRESGYRAQLVQVSLDGGDPVEYEDGIYRTLAGGPMRGQKPDAVIEEAVRLTKLARAGDGPPKFEEIVDRIAESPKETEVESATKPPDDAPEPGPTPVLDKKTTETERAISLLPKVRVQFEGSFGTFRTRYHEVEHCGDFLALLFDNRCEMADMYDPPRRKEMLKVSVGENDEDPTVFSVASIGISLDLKRRGIHLTLLPIVPDDKAGALQPDEEVDTPFAGGT